MFYHIHSRCDAIILYSKHEIKNIQPKNRHKVFVANNTINFDPFPEVIKNRGQIKREFGIPFEKTVLFVGRMRPLKKVEHLIQAFNSIDDPGAGCVIVGDSMDYDIHAMIRKDNIRFLGEVMIRPTSKSANFSKWRTCFAFPAMLGWA